MLFCFNTLHNTKSYEKERGSTDKHRQNSRKFPNYGKQYLISIPYIYWYNFISTLNLDSLRLDNLSPLLLP